MEYLYLEDGRADDDYKNGRLSEFEVWYYENFHGKGKAMIDSKIQEDNPTHKELASDYHWEQLADEGATTFSSSEEERTVSLDEVMHECLCDMQMEGIFELVKSGLGGVLWTKFEARIDTLMNDAMDDFYDD